MGHKRPVAKYLLLAAKIALTAALLWYLFRGVDIRDMALELKRASLIFLFAATAQLALQPLLGALRWRVVLDKLDSPLPFAEILRLTYIGTFFNQALPATVGGDAIRIWLTYRAGCSIKNAVNSVGLDRVAMLMGLVVMVAATMPWFGQHLEINLPILLVPILLVSGAGGLGLVMLGDRLPPALHKWRAARAVSYLAADTRRVFLSPASLTAILTISIFSYVNIAITVFLFSLAFDQAVSMLYFLVLIPPVILASTLPISVGGWGTREMAMVLALGTVAVTPGIALLISTLLGIGSIIISLPGAAFYLARRHPRDAVSPMAVMPELAETDRRE